MLGNIGDMAGKFGGMFGSKTTLASLGACNSVNRPGF